MSELNDKLVCVVGHRRLQNELMALFLERETGARCIECTEVSGIPEMKKGSAGEGFSKLIMFDCHGMDAGKALAMVEEPNDRKLSESLLALFNVTPGLGIEQDALRLGVRGVFYEQDPFELYPKGVRAIFQGELWVPRDIMTRCVLEDSGRPFARRKELSILTEREIEILTMVSAGAKNEEIAEKLCISPHTVKTHIYNIFKKIGVPNRLQAALWAAKNL